MPNSLVERLSKMENAFLSSQFIRTDSLQWADSEVKSQSPLSFIGDSQFPFSVPVCADSQDVDVQRPRPEDPSSNTLDSSEPVGSSDMRCWDLAEGEPKSQSNTSRIVPARTLQCPPPSLDTQEFELRYMREEQKSPEKCFQSPEASSLEGMACWDLAEGEVISQDAGRPIANAETPDCPPASLDSEEFMRRCAAEDILKLLIPAGDVDGSPVDEFRDRNGVDYEARLDSPLQLPGEDNTPQIALSPVGGKELALGLGVKDNVATANHMKSTAAAPNDIRSKTHFNTSQPQRMAAPSCPETAANELREDNKEENVSSSAKSEKQEDDTRSDSGFPTERLPQEKGLAAVQDGALASDPAQPLPLRLPKLSTDTESNVQHHRSKRKSQEKSSPSRDDCLATRRIPAPKCQLSNPELSTPRNRSPLKPISINTGLINDLRDEKIRIPSRQSCKPDVSLSKGENIENTAHIVASELISSSNYRFEISNMEFREVSKEIASAVTATSAGEPKTKTRTKVGAGEKSGSLDPTEVILQTSKRIRVDDAPRPALGLHKNRPDKTRSVQTRVSSRVTVTSHAARVVKEVSGEPEQDQGWLCPKASKSLLKKPKQRVLDTWLK